MLHLRKVLCMFLLALLLVQPVFAETEATTQPPEPDIVTALYPMQTLPGNWSPLSSQTEETQFLLELTTAPLYEIDGAGTWQPVLARELPIDVTEEFAGNPIYSVPANASRGYAFRILLNGTARWDDGSKITADDYIFSIKKLLEQEQFSENWTFLANAAQIRSGESLPSDSIVSLHDAGFSSVQEAWQAGYTDFFVDTSGFWGLDQGWKSVSDRNRLRDYAMPGGLDEYFVSPAYLYSRYLMDGSELSRFQREFLGICDTPGPVLTMDDLGIIRVHSFEFILILEEPSTASSLMLNLQQLHLFCPDHRGDSYGTSAETYCAYGPYTITFSDVDQIILEPNPYWCGDVDPRGYDRILCTGNGKD